MTSRPLQTVENNFTKGFVTEYTGLNFPENAATDTDNCTYGLVGDVLRRLGYDLELNFHTNAIDRTNLAINSYKWNNVAGQGEQQFLVTQVGSTLYFWDIDASTVASPLSNNLLATTVDVSSFVATGGTYDATKECQFSDGNGYLFVYHPSCNPFYCAFASGVITASPIDVQIRDFQGVNDGLSLNTRPTTATGLSDSHLYNLSNQGWTQGAAWSAFSSPTQVLTVGSRTFTVAAGIVGITPGDAVNISAVSSTFSWQHYPNLASGNVTSYAGTVLTVNITSISASPSAKNFTISPTNHGYITTWNTAVGSYPSNADVWWTFKNATDVFDPATQINNTTLNTGFAPKGHYLLNAFSQQRDTVSALDTIDDVVTLKRPRLGTWFQGRVWYTGVDDSQQVTGVANAYTWTENIYFSQVVTDPTQFGNCYQANDPTSETLFGLLPTDGGVIVIQGSGPIYKLFPFQNGVLVFAANGIWYITGSQGIGFAATDYTVNEISKIKCISTSSFVDVQGLPYFWNEDGIYSVQPSQGGGLSVQSITYSTIDTFFSEIPLTSKKLARGDYDPINYAVRWIYKDAEATDVTSRYTFNKILNYNTANKAFFPYTIDTTSASINSINFISGPGGITGPPPAFRSLTTYPAGMTFSEESSTDYKDWTSTGIPVDYLSYFVTGYRLHGKGVGTFQMPYLFLYSRNIFELGSAYKVQGMWDYSISGDTGRWSTAQLINIFSPNFGMVFRRHRIRGRGIVLQIKVKSVTGQPFDIMGWTTSENVNVSP